MIGARDLDRLMTEMNENEGSDLEKVGRWFDERGFEPDMWDYFMDVANKGIHEMLLGAAVRRASGEINDEDWTRSLAAAFGALCSGSFQIGWEAHLQYGKEVISEQEMDA